MEISASALDDIFDGSDTDESVPVAARGTVPVAARGTVPGA
jgi:hypothetical protein